MSVDRKPRAPPRAAPTGRFAGMPMGVKDNIENGDQYRSSCGSPIRRRYRPL
ncbi:MAG: hypothetical protein HPM95_08670 [Alphaproteobacteria bacterium]|nr:hypothetical protein [Alphaproteobacteria bacterium]